MKFSLFIFIGSVLFFGGIPLLYAQIPSVGESVEISLEPQIPGPNTTVRVTAQSFSFEIDRATLRWVVNGKEVASGVGQTTAEFATGASGSTLTIALTILTPQGNLIERELSFVLGSLDLIIEPQTYTPPFYRGRALPSYGAQLRLIALPDASAERNDFLYRWERDYEVIEGLNGVARSVVSLRSPDFAANTTFSVEAISANSQRLRREVAISNVEPLVVLYEQSALRGIIYERAVPVQATLEGKEVTYVAEPYFFSVARRSDGVLSYQWTIDGSAIESGARSELTLRQDTEGSGTATIGLNIQNEREILQAAVAAITLIFDTSE